MYVSDIFYIVTMWLTKCSVAFLFLRLSPDKRHKLASHILLGASTVFMVISVLVVSLRCNIAQPWIFLGNRSCSSDSVSASLPSLEPTAVIVS